MVFCISFITTFTIQTPTKKSPSDICLKPKNIYKVYKLYNAKQEKLKEHRNKFLNQIFKLLNYKYLLIEKNNLNLQKKLNKFHKKTKREDMFLTFE
jgi:hypothetical protein